MVFKRTQFQFFVLNWSTLWFLRSCHKEYRTSKKTQYLQKAVIWKLWHIALKIITGVTWKQNSLQKCIWSLSVYTYFYQQMLFFTPIPSLWQCDLCCYGFLKYMQFAYRYSETYLASGFPKHAHVLSMMLHSHEAVRLVGRKPLKTSSGGSRRERVTETEDFYYQQGFF